MSQPTLFLSGLSRSEEAELQQLLTQIQGQLQPHWRLTPEAEASALLIDMDSMYGQMALMKALGTGKTLIALTEGARADTPHLLRRPYDGDALARVLNAAAADSLLPEPAPTIAPPAVAPSVIAAMPAPTPAPPAAVEPTPAPTIEPAPSEAAPDLPGALDLQAQYKLERWPTIDRAYPKQFRIATLMLKGPARLQDIADATGASLDEVVEFVQAKLLSGHARVM